jgi:hypothetical protein
MPKFIRDPNNKYTAEHGGGPRGVQEVIVTTESPVWMQNLVNKAHALALANKWNQTQYDEFIYPRMGQPVPERNTFAGRVELVEVDNATLLERGYFQDEKYSRFWSANPTPGPLETGAWQYPRNGFLFAVTGVTATDIFTVGAVPLLPLVNTQTISFSGLTGGSGLVAGTTYYVLAPTALTFQVSATPGGSAVNFTTDLTAGTATVVPL